MEFQAFVLTSDYLSKKPRLGFESQKPQNRIGANPLRSVTTPRKNYDVAVGCTSGVCYVFSDPVNFVDHDGLKRGRLGGNVNRIRNAGNYSPLNGLPTSLQTLNFQNSYNAQPKIFKILRLIEAYKQTSYQNEIWYYRISWTQAFGTEYRYNWNLEISYDTPITTGFALPYKPTFYQTFDYMTGSFKGDLPFYWGSGCK